MLLMTILFLSSGLVTLDLVEERPDEEVVVAGS